MTSKFFKYRARRKLNASRLKDSIKWSHDYWYKIFKGKRKHKPCYADIHILLTTNISEGFWISATVKSEIWLARGK